MKAARDQNSSEDVQKIERSIAYMMRYLDQPLRVAELAAQANVSSSHYFALFKRLTGRAPIDYFIRLRMKRAGTMLASTTASVKEIAGVLGYKDPFYFSRVFKSVHSAAPTQYRARRRESTPTGEPPLADGFPERSGEEVLPATSNSKQRFPVAPAFQLA